MSRLIAICVATYKRPQMLDRLLQSLARMDAPLGFEIEVRVVDNDAAGSAREVAAKHGHTDGTPFRLRYTVEPRASISLARNRSIEMGPAELLFFIDDDEVADPRCLVEMLDVLDRTGRDAVVGWVEGELPASAPAWMKRGGFFEHPTGRTGEPLHWRGTRCGATVVLGRWFYDHGFRFDPDFGRSGAEDVDLFARMALRGARYTSAAEARVVETVPADRATFGMLWQRHWRCGMCTERLGKHYARRLHPLVQLVARLGRSGLVALVGLLPLLLGRPETLIRAVLGLALAGGGLAAWISPQRARAQESYGPASSGLDSVEDATRPADAARVTECALPS